MNYYEHIISRLQQQPECSTIVNIMQDEINRLTEERDDLRRAILESIHPDLRKAYAEAKEWDLPDCFKENTNG